MQFGNGTDMSADDSGWWLCGKYNPDLSESARRDTSARPCTDDARPWSLVLAVHCLACDKKTILPFEMCLAPREDARTEWALPRIQ